MKNHGDGSRTPVGKLSLALLIMLLPVLSAAKSDAPTARNATDFVCGTSFWRGEDAVARERYRVSLARRHPVRMQSTQQATQTDFGDVAVIQDDGTLVTTPVAFDLSGKSIRFEPAVGGSGYRIAAAATSFDSSGSTPLPLDDDEAVSIDLGFAFNFFGQSYQSVFVNSDGNLTFGQPDTASSARSLGRLTSGAPRIAPLFSDLDPSANGNVSYRKDSDGGVLFSWAFVPNFGIGNNNSASAKLFRDGTIEFIYGGVGATEVVVGISPGSNSGAVNAVEYSSVVNSEILSGTIAQVFTKTATLSETAIARQFFRNHPDSFDQLVIFLGFDYNINGAFAYEINTKNEISGIGSNITDNARSYGSNGRLKSFVLMGSLEGAGHTFPSDPNVNFFRTYNTLQVLAHEVAHRWLAFTNIEEGGRVSQDLLHPSPDLAHWSFFFNADGSVMEGNALEDRGVTQGNGRFATVGATHKYSALDKYLMGYAGPEEVPPMFYVQNPTATTKTASSLPTFATTTFGGTRKDFTIGNIINANGPRVPSVYQSPKVLRQAFILVTKAPATSDQISKVQNIRNAWVSYFNEQTGGRGWAVTSLQETPETTSTPIFFPYFEGSSTRYTGIAVANWGSTAADVLFNAYDNSGQPLSSSNSILNPRILTLGPGAQMALLGEQIHGLTLNDSRNGWIKAQSTSSHVSAFFLDGDVGQNLLTGAVAGHLTAKSVYFTRALPGPTTPQSGSYTNRISIVNPNDSPANLTFTLLNQDGRITDTATRPVAPMGRIGESIASLFPGLSLLGSNGYVAVTSDRGVVGYQSVNMGTTAFSQPGQVAGTAGTLYSAQFASGRDEGGTQYFTELTLVNTGASRRFCPIRLVDNNGNPINGITSPSVQLEPGQQYRQRGESMFGLANAAFAQTLVEGSLIVSCDGAGVIGDVLFGDPRTLKFLASVPLDGTPASSLVLSQVAEGAAGGTKPYFTGVALYNPNSGDVQVKMDVYSAPGSLAGTSSFILGSGKRLSETLPQLVPAIRSQAGGYIRITSINGPIVCFELFGTTSLDFLTAVPPQLISP